jgi:hypothetical protein
MFEDHSERVEIRPENKKAAGPFGAAAWFRFGDVWDLHQGSEGPPRPAYAMRPKGVVQRRFGDGICTVWRFIGSPMLEARVFDLGCAVVNGVIW